MLFCSPKGISKYRGREFRRLWGLLFFLIPLAGFAGGRTAKTARIGEAAPPLPPPHESAAGSWSGDAEPGEPGLPAAPFSPAAAPENRAQNQDAPSRAETVMRALAAAYPDRIEGLEKIDGDWTVLVYGERFYFAEGRMLPEALKEKADEYDPQPFYNYLKELPPWEPPDPEESARMKEQEARRRASPSKRSPHFCDALWRIRDRDESWQRVKQIRFLGHPIMAHYSVLVELSLVEERILKLADTSAEVRNWIAGINKVDGWNWRNIAITQSRSYHSYGAALDILPKSYRGLETYWLWSAQKNLDWWAIPYTGRFHPPGEVIKAFEAFGFIWGGKWRYYDTMHFEYRPELLILGGIERVNYRDLR